MGNLAQRESKKPTSGNERRRFVYPVEVKKLAQEKEAAVGQAMETQKKYDALRIKFLEAKKIISELKKQNSRNKEHHPSKPDFERTKNMGPNKKHPSKTNIERTKNLAPNMEHPSSVGLSVEMGASVVDVLPEKNHDGDNHKLLKKLEVFIKERKKKEVFALLRTAVAKARSNGYKISDELKDNVNCKIMAAEFFTVGVLLHPFFLTPLREQKEAQFDVEIVLRQNQMDAVTKLVTVVVYHFHGLLDSCYSSWRQLKSKRKERGEEGVTDNTEWFQATNSLEEKVLSYLANTFVDGMSNEVEHDVHFLTMMVEAKNVSVQKYKTIFQDCSFFVKDVDLFANGDCSECLWTINRNASSGVGEFFLKKRELNREKRIYDALVVCCLLLVMGFLEENVGGVEAWEKGKAFIKKFVLKLSEWSDKVSHTVNPNRKHISGDKLVWVQVDKTQAGKYQWENGKTDYSVKKGKTSFQMYVRRKGSLLYGKRLSRNLKTRWIRTLTVLGLVWEFGVVGLTGAWQGKFHANSHFPTILAYAITGCFSPRGKECKIPEVMKAILPSLSQEHTAHRPHAHALRLFDPIYYYGWGLPGVMDPVIVNMKALCLVLEQVKETATTRIADLLRTSDNPLERSAVLLDLMELRALGKKEAAPNTTFQQVSHVLDFFKEKKHVTYIYAGASLSTTPGMNRYALSSRARPLNLGRWKYLVFSDDDEDNKKILRKFAKGLTLDEDKILKKAVRKAKQTVVDEKKNIEEAMERINKSVNTL